MAILQVITENQRDKSKAEKLYLEITKILDNCSLVSIEKYYKFENSYKITININIDKDNHYNDNVLMLAYSIASPWILYYDTQNKKITEFIFNKKDSSIYNNQKFNVITWMLIDLTTE